MYLNQVKFGEVIHHVPTDQYSRVIGLRLVEDVIFIEVNRILKPADTSESWRERKEAEPLTWNPKDCSPQTPREKGEEGSVYYFMEQESIAEREV